jgi:hypothetical protein
MKIIIGGLLLLALAPGSGLAQFTGKLVYEVDGTGTRLVMAYYQDGNQAHLEAYNIKMIGGVTDTTTIKPQDTLLYDFSKATNTHLLWRSHLAVVAPYTIQVINSGGIQTASAAVQKMGSEIVNGYHCTHYIETIGKATHDLWVTNDLNVTPSVMIISSYLYYTPGHPHLQQLAAAGCTGLLVKSVSGGAGLPPVTMNLISVDMRTRLSPRLFQIPSYYTVRN